MFEQPKVFIIVLNFNGAACLPQTLGSLSFLDYPNYQVILVDNNSTDGSLEKARTNFPELTCIKNSENLGFSLGNNIGIKYALERGARYILLLNYDVIIKNDFLSPLIGKMESDPKIGIASPVIKNRDSIWFSGGKIDWLKMKTSHKQNSLTHDYFGSDFISGCAMLIRKEVFKKIGLLDEDFFLYWEDADFSVRARRAGYKLLVTPESEIIHTEKSEEKKTQKIYWLVLSGLLFFKKNTPFWLRPWIAAYSFARRLKNRKDRRENSDPIADCVHKAYQDFNR